MAGTRNGPGAEGEPPQVEEKESFLCKLKSDAAFERAEAAQEAACGGHHLGPDMVGDACEEARVHYLEAVRHLSRAIELQPWMDVLYFERSAAYARMGMKEEAEKDMDLYKFCNKTWGFDGKRYWDSGWKPPNSDRRAELEAEFGGGKAPTEPHFSQRV